MKQFFFNLTILFFVSGIVSSQDKIYSNKPVTSFFIQPDVNSPMIYPIESGYELSLLNEEGEWSNVIDLKTGLKGWVLKGHFTKNKPEKIVSERDHSSSFKIFKEKILEMSASIEEAIGAKTFIDVKHLGGVAATIFADDDWFKARRHQNQAFQVYEIWKTQNQSPSFLSFKDSDNKERFIILSGPHRPRLLKADN